MKVYVDADPANTKDILTLLEELGYSVPCNCHGAHRCSGNVYSFDCAMIPVSPVEVTIPAAVSDLAGVSLEDLPPRDVPGDTILIDLGTTTVSLALIRRKDASLCKTATFANPQLRFGTDIIARIQSAASGAAEEMQQMILEKIEQETSLLCKKNHQSPSELHLCCIGGNTAMVHLLMGYDCTGLGHSPFTIRETSPAPFFYGSCEIRISPWISAFVGGDITAGLCACRMPSPHQTILLVDLGTNGEMVLSHNGTLYAAATAAGPALEGGGLSCGCPAIPGAIRNVRLKRLMPSLDTIQNRLPEGICGSGAISLLAELVRHHYVTEEGILTDRFPSQGILLSHNKHGAPLYFTAGDLRNIQLAAAAIAAGIDTLSHCAGIHPSEISRLCLGGSFGFSLSEEDCETVGLFSHVPACRIHPLGNTCLRGLYRSAVTNTPLCSPEKCRVINLADNPCFREKFVDHMSFPAQPAGK